MGAMLDKLNKMSEFTYDNEGVIPEQYRTEEQKQLFNPLHDLTSWVEEWRDDLIKRGQDIANKAGEAYKAGVLADTLDDMSLPQQDMSSVQEKVATALQDAVDDARYAATKQPISFAGDVAGALNPWIPLAVQVPIMVKEMQMAQQAENAPEMSDQAKAALLPMLGGTVAASLTHGVGGLLAKTAPMASKIMTTPFVGSGVAAGTMLAMDENTRKYASEHPQRFAVNTFTTDAAIGVKKLAKTDWSIKTNPVTNTEVIADKTNPSSTPVVENKATELSNKAIGEPTTTKISEIKPLITKESKPVTPKEEAFPERRPDIIKSQELLADQIADEIREARKIPEVMQGAYGDKLTYSKDNLYPKNVSVNDIWQTFKQLVPIRPNGMGARPDSTLGFFNTVGKGIRVRGFKSWSVMCHELGHAASDALGFARGAEVEMELAKGAHSIWKNGEYGDFNSPEGFSTYIEEGRAAFMNEYLVNPEMAKKHFPLTYASFEQALATDLIWQGHMNTIGQQVRRWGNMNVMQKAAGTTQWGDTTNTGIAQRISNWKDGIEAGYSDEFAPLRNAKNSWEKAYGIKTAIEDDPAILAQRAKESINASELTMVDGNGFDTATAIQQLANKFGTSLNSVVASDIFLPFTVGGERGVVLKQWLEKSGMKDYYEAFSKYQGAKHELEVIKVKNTERIKKSEAAIKDLEKQIQSLAPHLEKANGAVDKLTMVFAPMKQQYDTLKLSTRETMHTLSDLKSQIAKDTNLIKRLEHRLATTEGKVDKTMNKGMSTVQRLHQEEKLFPNDVQKAGETGKAKSVILDEKGNALHPNKMMMGRYKQLLKIYYRDVNNFRDMADIISADIAVAKSRLSRNTMIAEEHTEKLAAAQKQLEELKGVLSPIQKDLSKAKRELARLEEATRLRREQQKAHAGKIKDIKDGNDDYATSMTRQENEAILEMCKGIPEFEVASKLWKAWNDNVLRIAVAGGILKKSTKDYFQKTYPEYIPMKRDFTIEGDLSAHGDIMHALTEEGSSRVVKDPMMQAVLDMKTVVSKVERNRVGQALAKMANGEYGHYLMMRVPDGKEAKAHQIITVWEEGKPTYYQCTADGLYDAYTSANKAFVQMNVDVITEMQQNLATVLRFGATSTPAFALWNLGRDILDAVILNRDGRRHSGAAIREPLLTLWDGLSVVLSDTKTLGIGKMMAHLDKNNAANRNLKAEYMTQGVQYTTMLHTPKDITSHFRKIVTPKSELDIAKTIVSKHIRTLLDFNEACEQIARMGLYKRARKRGGSAIEAATVASDSTVNFMRSGTRTKAINKITPFFNATIQGGLKFFREVKNDPIGVGLAAFECITLPTLFCYAMNKDEDWYRDMPLDQKNKAWYLKINDTICSFPKPPVLGQLCGSLVERALDVMYQGDDMSAADDCLLKAVQGFFPTYTAPSVEKVFEWQSNYNFYKGRPIVDQRLGKLSDKYQYNVYTSEIAKGVGNLFNVSPMKVDNTFYGLTGSMGYAFNGLMDYALKTNETPDRKWTEYTRATYTEGGRQTRSQDIFYKGMDKLEKQSNDAKRLGTPLKDTKAFEGMKTARDMAKLITNGIDKNTKASRNLGKWARDPDVRRGLRSIEADPKLSGAEKRAKIDKLVKIRNDIYRTANKKYLNYKYIQSPE